MAESWGTSSYWPSSVKRERVAGRCLVLGQLRILDEWDDKA